MAALRSVGDTSRVESPAAAGCPRTASQSNRPRANDVAHPHEGPPIVRKIWANSAWRRARLAARARWLERGNVT